VLAHALGLNHRMWAPILPHLPPSLRIIRFDMRGHGHSAVPPAPYGMGALVRDLETLLEALEIRDAVILGLSLGGFVAQGLAVKRLDLVRGLILSNTAARIGHPGLWQARIQDVEQGGMDAVAEGILSRWFARGFLQGPDVAPWRAMLLDTPAEGYAGCCAAISGTDFYTPTSGLRLPTLGIAGSEDRATPPDLVRETTGLIPGAEFALLRRAGHIPPADQPKPYADLITGFLKRIGHT